MGWRYVYCPVCKWSAGEVGILVKARSRMKRPYLKKECPRFLNAYQAEMYKQLSPGLKERKKIDKVETKPVLSTARYGLVSS